MVGILVTSITGTVLTYFFVERIKWTTVKSSALLTLFFSCLMVAINHYLPFDHDLYCYYFFGASFVGMTTTENLSYYYMMLAGLLYGFLLYWFSAYTAGIGGALGSTALITVIVVFLLKKVIFFLKSKGVQ